MTHAHQLYLCMAVPLYEQFCYTKFRVTAQFVLQHKLRVCCHCSTQVGSSTGPKQCFMCFMHIHFLASVFKVSIITLFYLLYILKKYLFSVTKCQQQLYLVNQSLSAKETDAVHWKLQSSLCLVPTQVPAQGSSNTSLGFALSFHIQYTVLDKKGKTNQKMCFPALILEHRPEFQP